LEVVVRERAAAFEFLAISHGILLGERGIALMMDLGHLVTNEIRRLKNGISGRFQTVMRTVSKKTGEVTGGIRFPRAPRRDTRCQS